MNKKKIIARLSVILIISFVFTSACNNKHHKDSYQDNMDYNTTLTKDIGGYVDSCMTMVLKDMQSQGLSAGDFRILSYGYEDALNTIPKDTTGKFYSFDIIYTTSNSDKHNVMAAAYLINFSGKINRVYNVDVNDPKAKKQMEALKENFTALKRMLEEIPDSADQQIEKLKKSLRSLD